MLKLGFDMDGCGADFNPDYVRRILKITGVNRFDGDEEGMGDNSWPDVWSYPEEYGYTPKELAAVWRSIGKDERFWQDLKPLDGFKEVVPRLDAARDAGHDLYFITARPGFKAKLQTEHWLMGYGLYGTVLMASDKAAAIKLLNLDAYLDDRLSNANACMEFVRQSGRMTRVYLLDAPYNQRPVLDLPEGMDGVPAGIDARDPGLVVVKDIAEMLAAEGL